MKVIDYDWEIDRRLRRIERLNKDVIELDERESSLKVDLPSFKQAIAVERSTKLDDMVQTDKEIGEMLRNKQVARDNAKAVETPNGS